MSLRERLQGRMTELGLVAKRSLGQNFLVSQDVVDKILNASSPETFAHVWEVGPGLGALTDGLRERASRLQLVEMDRQLATYWEQQGLVVHLADALQFPWSETLAKAAQDGPKPSALLVSNLPYQISSRLVIDLSLLQPSFDRMVLMFQKEVAQRITSQHQGSEYGLLTVVVATFWKVRTLLEAGTRDFYPSPNVASRVLVFDRKPVSEWKEFADPRYLNFLKRCFEQRRKKLAPRLLGSGSAEAAVHHLESLGIRGDARPQQLSPQNYMALYRLLKNE